MYNYRTILIVNSLSIWLYNFTATISPNNVVLTDFMDEALVRNSLDFLNESDTISH